MQTHNAARPGAMAITDATGLWRIAPTSGGKSACLIALNSLAAPRGYQLHIETCSIQPLASARSWRPIEQGFEFLDVSGRAIVAFRREDVDSFRAVDGAYRMERAAVGA